MKFRMGSSRNTWWLACLMGLVLALPGVAGPRDTFKHLGERKPTFQRARSLPISPSVQQKLQELAGTGNSTQYIELIVTYHAELHDQPSGSP